MQKTRPPMKKLLAPLLLAVALAMAQGATPAFAGTAQDTFQVTASVVPSCRFTTAVDVNFGDLDVYGFGTKLANGSVSVLCTKAGSYTIELDNGVNPDGSGNRQMANGTAVLPYELYQDQATTKVWKSGNDALAFAGDGLIDAMTVYGVLVWTQDMLPNAPVGSYADTVTATVNY